MSRSRSRTARIRPTRAAAVACAVAGALALTGCGAGQITQTSEQVAAVGGANTTVGAIAVRNAEIEFDTAAHDTAAIYLAGASAPLQMTVVNTGAEADRLVAASSPVATAVEISGVSDLPGGQALVVEGVPAPVAAEAPPAAESTATPGAPSAPGAEPTPEAPATPPAEAATTEEGVTGATTGQARTASVVLTGLLQDLQVGPTYPVVLTFERAGDVRVDVPIGNPATPRQDQH